MAVPTKVIIDCETNIVSEIPLTDEEIAQQAADAARFAEEQAAKDAADKAKADAKASAEAKLTSLGLTSDEVSALLG